MVTETRVASALDSQVSFMRELPHRIVAMGLETGPLSQWLHRGLAPTDSLTATASGNIPILQTCQRSHFPS